MDDQPYGSKSDVWSVGCIVHELATLSPPFNGKAIGAVVYQILNAEPPSLPPCYSRELQDLVKTLLTKDARVRSGWWSGFNSETNNCVALAQARPEIKEVLRSEFVLRRVFQIASTAPSSRLQHVEQSASVDRSAQAPPPQVNALIVPQQPQIPLPYQQAPVAAIFPSYPSVAGAVQDYTFQHRLVQQQIHPHVQPRPDQRGQPTGDDMARQIFFENQVLLSWLSV